MATKSSVALENGLDLRKVVTTGSILHINDVYDEGCYTEPEEHRTRNVDIIGKPVPNFEELEKTMASVDEMGYVKKIIIDEGGGLPLNVANTVSVAFSGYWENDLEPFDSRKLHKPLVIDLKENGLLPGLQIAIQSMLVGETSLFLFTHHFMYGEMGIPPRIKPKAKCVFYIKLIKSQLTPKEGEIDFSELNTFGRVLREAVMLHSSGITLHKTNNFPAAIQMFRKAIFNLHKCRLADENEEKEQEKMLIKLYYNLAVCYNITKQPSKACTACNELIRLKCLWNNGKALFQNAKALRMIGEFDIAEKRLNKAITLLTRQGLDKKKEQYITAEKEALQNARKACNRAKLVEIAAQTHVKLVTDNFKSEVDNLIKNFKQNNDMCKLVMPSGLNSSEMAYIRETCIRENVFFSKFKRNYSLEDEENNTNVKNILNPEVSYALDKFGEKASNSSIVNDSEITLEEDNNDEY